MPTKPRYPRQISTQQFQIIREIALAGHLSNDKLSERLKVSHSVISEAVKVLSDRKMIQFSYSEMGEHKSGRPEKYYALTLNGMNEFINRKPTPEDFFNAILKTYNLRQQSRSIALKPMTNEVFEQYYKRFEQNYLGSTSNHAYLVQSPFFTRLYEQWLAEYRPRLFEQNYLRPIIDLIHSPLFEKCYDESLEKYDQNGITVVQKVLECLAINRSITERQLIENLSSKQEDINNKLIGKIGTGPDFIRHKIKHDYGITEENIKRVINRYTFTESFLRGESQMPEDFEYSRIMKKYLEFLSHLIVIKKDNVNEPRYELSLLGILLTLAIITHPYQKMFFKDNGQKNSEDLIAFYNIVSNNYTDKLPLIFGKWALLTDIWRYAYQWFFPVLYQNVMDEFARAKNPGSVSISLGGVKEYQEIMHEIAFHAAARLFDLYRGISSVIHHTDEAVSEIPLLHGNNKAGLLTLEKKQRELAALLKYVDLGKFVAELNRNRNSSGIDQRMKTIYDSELSIIEKALASEITFLFYINLARDRFIDYTNEGRNFLGDERDTDYKATSEYYILKPVDYLRMILKSDKELKILFRNWIADIKNYHYKTGQQIEEFERTIEKLNRSK